jgi:hypothetical protein
MLMLKKLARGNNVIYNSVAKNVWILEMQMSVFKDRELNC